MQIHCKPGGLEDKDPKTESGFSSKIMQKHSKPGSVEDQDPKSETFKIEFGPKTPAATKLWKYQQVMLNVHLLAKSKWIWHQSCKFTVNHLVWRIRISKLNLGLAPKSCKYMQIYCKPAGLQDQDLKAEPGFGTKFMQIHCLPGGLDDQDTKSEISKIKFAS